MDIPHLLKAKLGQSGIKVRTNVERNNPCARDEKTIGCLIKFHSPKTPSSSKVSLDTTLMEMRIAQGHIRLGKKPIIKGNSDTGIFLGLLLNPRS